MDIKELEKRGILLSQIERLVLLNDENRVMKEHRVIIEEKITKLLEEL